MSDNVRSSTIRIRNLEFSPRARSVTADGRKTLLDARSCTLLLVFAEHLGEAVTKEDLLSAAWPRHLVQENSLVKAIGKLRRALAGSGVEIAAVYGFGYMLREIDDTAAEPLREACDQPPFAANPRPAPRYASGQSIAGLLLLLIVGLAFMAAAHRGREVPIRQTLPITHDSPDAIATILWVDDHPSNNQLEVEAFKRHRIAVHLAESTDDALKLLALNDYRLVVSDLGRGEDRLAGLKMAKTMKERGIGVPVIIYTVRAKDRAGQEQQRKLVAESGAVNLAVTPQEIRALVLKRLSPAV